MNIRRLKSLLWFTVFLAFLLAGWTFWDIFQGKTKEMRYESTKDDTYYSDILHMDVEEDTKFQAGPTSYSAADYEQVWLARIDGSVEPVAKPTGPGADGPVVEQEVQLDKLDEVVQVGMLLYHNNPLSRLIAVEYVKDAPNASPDAGVKSRRLHLTQGEPLRPPYDAAPYHGKVIEIRQQDVVFQWGEEEVTLTPGLDSSGDGMPVDTVTFPAVGDIAAEYEEWPEETIQRDDGSYLIGTTQLEELADGGDELQSQLSVRSITPAGGGRSSIEFTDVKPGSMPARFGFQTGDRIISVNGHPVSSVAEGINWGKNNPNEPQYNVLWERRGVQETLVIHNKDKK